MKTTGGSDAAKRRAGERAAERAEDGFVVGLGTGSTTAYAIDALGRAIDDGLEIRGIPTSFQSRQTALEASVPLTTLEEVDGVDLAIDGADQVADDSTADAYGALIKGGGGAHTREKLVDAAADEFVVVADPSKLAPTLERSVPVEVIPDAYSVVSERVRELGGDPTLRAAECKDGPVVTDNGNLLLDCAFGSIDDPEGVASTLARVPGVLEHGLFVDLADITYVGTDDGVETREY
ncbi:ribose-5-phosphate isomerase RpiA [Natronorubrum daqingense]|uniref:Ribose-5-phosphate isomerase A n=1 Tax=Natronorubrum daqingense TaxID=588898 RepID=A0A1N7F9G5_9EURY|nr:ribose-5-phosphate isomerase RpiA [Natronorubrum daqingense]APX97625.1 ribose 5-phosphate isomerase A [Natronorubrum daqingense]SIR96902.1 ribose-5-phosphate isomerase [Natronorubrum daqingense]